MITINLLPPSEIKGLKLANLYFFLWRRIIALSIFLFLIAALFLGADLLLRRNFKIINAQLENKKHEANASSFLDLKNKIDQFNQNLEQVARLQAIHNVLNPALVELVRLTPSQMRFTSLIILSKDGYVELTGVAEKREYLLDFQDRLERSEFFEAVESPLSNLTSRENVEFKLRFKLAPLP